jgi:hypothetical protein
LISIAFEIEEHDAVAELGVASDYASADDDGAIVEPESGMNTGGEWESHHQLNVAAAPTEVGGLEVHGDVVAFEVDFDLHIYGVARKVAAIVIDEHGSRGLRVGRMHGWSPRLGRSGSLAQPLG